MQYHAVETRQLRPCNTHVTKYHTHHNQSFNQSSDAQSNMTQSAHTHVTCNVSNSGQHSWLEFHRRQRLRGRIMVLGWKVHISEPNIAVAFSRLNDSIALLSSEMRWGVSKSTSHPGTMTYTIWELGAQAVIARAVIAISTHLGSSNSSFQSCILCCGGSHSKLQSERFRGYLVTCTSVRSCLLN